MRPIKVFTVLIIGFFLLISCCLVFAGDQKIWVGPNVNADFVRLFEAGAAWPSVQKNMDVFRFHVDWLDKAPRDTLQKAAAVLKDVQVDVEAGGLRDWECAGAKMAEIELSKMQPWIDSGGHIDYISMDAPFGYTLIGNPQSPCRYTPQEASQQIIVYMKRVKAKFPQVKFGWIEPIPWYTVGSYRNHEGGLYGDLGEIMKVFMAHLDEAQESIDHFEADAPYDFNETTPDGWDKLKAVEQLVHHYGMRFGMFFNSDRGGNLPDEVFYNESLLSYRKFKAHRGMVDDVLIESWYQHPKELLPEDQPYTFMYLVKKFMEGNR